MFARAAALLPLIPLLLIVPTASAATIAGDLRADSVSSSSGGFEGGFLGAEVSNADGFTLQVAADEARIVLDNKTVDVRVAGAGATPAKYGKQYLNLSQVLAGSIEPLEDFRLLILPIQDLPTVAGEGLPFQATLGRSEGPYPPLASETRPPVTIAPGRSVAFGAGGEVTITGDVRLVVWSAQVAFHVASGSRHAFETGSFDPVENGLFLVTTSTYDVEAYIDLIGAELRVALPAGAPMRLSAPVVAADTLTVAGASGLVTFSGKEVALGSQDLVLQGRATARLSSSGESLEARLSGTPSHLVVGTQTIQSGDGQGPWTLLMWGASTAIVLYILYRVAGVLGRSSLERAIDAGDYGTALRRASRLRRLPRLRNDAEVVMGVCLLQMGRPADAEKALRAGRQAHRLPPGNNFLLARIAAGRGDLALARSHLTECLVRSPGYVIEARADPALQPIVQAAARELRIEGYT